MRLTFHFNEEDKYSEIIKLSEIAARLSVLNLVDNLDPQFLASELTNILLDACSKAGIKPKKKPHWTGSDEPWHDDECKKLKNSIKRKCRKLRKIPSNPNLQKEILAENKLLKVLIKRKKSQYKSNIIQGMSFGKKDQKMFWKLLDKLSGSTKDLFQDSISSERWQGHFKGVLRDDSREINYPLNTTKVGPLDYEITIEELKKASYVLKPNKASGYDSISNEMIGSLLELQPGILLKLFNSVFDNNAKIEQWGLAIITPIFKNGSKMNPNNYRGISILSCLGKLLSAILNARLLRFSLEHKILREEQLGFIAGNRTSDAHLILHTLIEKYCHKRGIKYSPVLWISKKLLIPFQGIYCFKNSCSTVSRENSLIFSKQFTRMTTVV